MYKIDIYFNGQKDIDNPYKTFTCDVIKELPTILKEVSNFVESSLIKSSKLTKEHYEESTALYLREPEFITGLDKVVVNGTLFKRVPTLIDLSNMRGYNPIVKVRLLHLLKDYPTVNAVGFSYNTAEHKGIGDFITIYASGDKYKVYTLARSIETLYNVPEDDYNDTYTVVSCVFNGVDTGFKDLLKRGVDF